MLILNSDTIFITKNGDAECVYEYLIEKLTREGFDIIRKVRRPLIIELRGGFKYTVFEEQDFTLNHGADMRDRMAAHIYVDYDFVRIHTSIDWVEELVFPIFIGASSDMKFIGLHNFNANDHRPHINFDRDDDWEPTDGPNSAIRLNYYDPLAVPESNVEENDFEL